MRLTSKAFIAAVGIFVVIAAIGFFLIPRGSLYGQAANSELYPDLKGVWAGEISGYFYDDVTDPDCKPLYFEGMSLDRDLIVTEQTGGTFAGETREEGEEEGRCKLTGVMLPDRTVSILYFEPSEERIFITGRLIPSGGQLRISGYLNYFDEFTSGSDRNMMSVQIRLIKVD